MKKILVALSLTTLLAFAGCNSEESGDESSEISSESESSSETEESSENSGDEKSKDSELSKDDEDNVFRLGFIPSEKAEELTPKAEVLAEFLEAEMEMEVEIFVPTEYETLIESLNFGHLDASYMDSGPAWLAHTQTGSEVVLAELKDGQPYYFGEVFIRADEEEIQSLDDAVGKSIAFTSWTGSSGFIFPIGTMVDRGLITPEGEDFVALEMAIADTFSEYVVAGGYEQALTLLVDGKVDIAAGAHDAIEKYLDEEDQDKVKTVERLGKVPSHPVVVSPELDQETQEKFVEAMMKLNDTENIEILQNLYGVDGLVETNTEEHLGDFGPIFEGLTGVHDGVLNKHKE